MRLVARLLFYTLIFSFITNLQGQNSASSTSDPVSINYVSTSDTSISSTLTGSFSGGTALYIQGIGFDSTFQNNIIYVGNNICSTTAKGVTQTNIVCYTSAYVSGPTSGLAISIFVLNKQPYTCSTSACLFSYTIARTPALAAVYPRASSANQWVNFYGVHRISDLGDGRDMGDVIGLYIGDSLCTRFDISQATIGQTSNAYIACSVVPTQEGGYYPIKQWVTPGIARNNYRMNFGSVLNNAQLYNFIVSPAISSLSSYAGGSQGNELTITGTGFSIQPNNITVSVAGIPCQVSSSSATQIQCTVQKTPQNNNYGKLQTNTITTQTNGFIQGTGFTYARYDTSSLQTQTIAYFRGKIGTTTEQMYKIPDDQQNTPKIIGQLQSPTIFADGPSKYGQVAKGYFIAPKTGDYIFRGLADDALQVFISPIKGSQQGINYSNPLLKSTQWSQSWSNVNYYIASYSGLTSDPITMTAGDAYYMQLYHLSFESSGFFKVSVEVPNDNVNYPNQVHEVQQIDIKPDVVPEILVFNVSGVNNGTILYKIQIRDPQTYAWTYNVNSTLPYNANADQFRGMLNSFVSFSNYYPSVVRQTFDNAGNPTNVAADIYSYIYTVTLQYYRPTTYSDDTTTKYVIKYDLTNAQHLPASSIQPQVTYSKTQQHSDPVGGTFSLTFNNTPIYYAANNTQFPYNIDISTFASKLNSAFGLNSIEVNVIGMGAVNGNSWIISYVGILGNILQIAADGSKLTGGRQNTIPNIVVSTLRQGSTNLLVEPVTTQFLGIPAEKSQVIVTVNGAVSRCLDDCTYEVDSTLTPKVTAASLNNNVLTLTIQSTTVPTADAPYNVKLNEQVCSFSSATTTQYVCNLPINNNDISSPVLEAGSYKPTLYIEGKGYADTSSVTEIQIPLQISSLNPSSGIINGGTIVALTGVGLPISAQSNFILKQCDIEVQVLSVSNTQIEFVSAPCDQGSSNVIIEFNNKTNSSSFTYEVLPANYPIINDIQPKTYSPVLKGFLIITGQNFGTSLSEYTIWLNKDNTNVYQLNVLEVTDTSIRARIPGGLPGKFDVLVRRNGFGFASLLNQTVNDFEYGIFVNNIQPTNGSNNGGTILTITGQNFSPVLKQNQVYIGNAINWNCDILTATTTQITCRTPAINNNYTNLFQEVIVVGRAMVDAQCKGSCTFNYINQSYPTIVPQSSNFIANQIITLTGTGLKVSQSSPNPKVYVGTIQTIVTAANDTSVTFTYPQLENGTYNVNVYVDGFGYASPTFSTNNLLSINKSASPQNGSTVGGTIYLKGNGLVDIGNPYLVFTATSNSVGFSYTVRNDNSATQFGIDYLGCTSGSSITLNYIYNKISTSKTYNCSTTNTPVITFSTTTLPYESASKSITFTKTSFTNIVPDLYFAYPVDTNNKRFGADIQLTKQSDPTATTFVVDVTPLTVGKYAFKFVYNSGSNQYGIASISSYLTITSTETPTIASNIDSAYTGGAHIQVNGKGLSSFSSLLISGISAKLVSATTTKLVYSTPPLVTVQSQKEFNLVNQQVLTGTFYSDADKNNQLAFDGLVSTLYSSTAASCYIGLDFGLNQQADIKKIRFYPNPTWKSAIPYIKGATISASNDGATWTTLSTLDSTVHTGWNIWKPENPLTQTYRYVAFKHNSTSSCNLAEFQISGYLYANGAQANLASNQRSISLNTGALSIDFAQKVIYKNTISPIVTGISPRYASPQTPTNISITGSGFGNVISQTSVVIDGIDCSVKSVSNQLIICTTGTRSSNPSEFSFVVSILGNTASIKTDNFMYAYRWSDTLTWGGDLAPIDGDTVYVPKGMVLLVDQSTPILYLLLVEGTIIFADESDMTIQSTFIIIQHGVFQAGTQAKAYQNQLTFILHGDYYGTQLPGFGNKVIGCHSCTFDLHGAKRDKTWTELQVTAQKGQSVLKLMEAVDWKVGEKVVVASSSFDHTQSQQLTIQSVSADKKQLTVTTLLRHNHLAVVETYGTDNITMRAQVGLISRNIRIQGDNTSVSKNYGAHVMMHGLASHGLVGRIQYTEFTHCGQPAIVGRYCIHFHMNGDVSDSYVRGNAVHHSLARVLTLHAVYYLTVEHNVGYWVKGHNIFLEDGIEQYNVIQYNLMISSLQVFNMLQTDISVASYWITNPLNTVRYNHAAGSDFYGLWYEIKPHPDGASATTDICPTGLPLGESHDNVAHSNDRFGLRIFQLWSSQNPCNKIRDGDLEDPWSANPSIQNKFYNFVLWRNAQDGLLIQRVGNTIFQNITVADSARAGVEFYRTNYTKQPVILRDCVIIAKSQNNGMPEGNYTKTSGLITSRTDGTEHDNIRFHNFPNGSTVISVAAKNTDMLVRSTGGKSYFFNNIKIINSSNAANYLEYIYTRRFILYDQDGSLSTYFDGQTRSSATIMPYYHHNFVPGLCSNATNQQRWDDSLICGPTAIVNNLDFGAAMPFQMFQGTYMSVRRLQNNSDTLADNDTQFAKTWVYKTDAEQKETMGFPFISGFTYSAWWSTGIDWTSVTMKPSYYFNPNDDGFIIRFNYTSHRELFDIRHIIAGKFSAQLLVQKSEQLNYSTCQFGDYYLDAQNQYLFVCVSGKVKTTFDLLNLNGIPCRYLCPKQGGGFEKENFLRFWSNASQWPQGRLPAAGDNITVNGNWSIMLDVDVIGLDNLTIDGDIFLTDQNRQLSANFIWIRYGSLNAGNSSTPFDKNFTITLNGQKSAKTYTIDEFTTLNKYIVVTGTLNLYGKVPNTITTRLSSIANIGDTTINVLSTNGWAVGNTIGIAPSWGVSHEYQSVTITALTATTVTFTPALNFSHYGQGYYFNNTYGNIDMRATVGLFDRNIKIQKGQDVHGWGYGVLMYAWDDGYYINVGTGTIRGVQFISGGQYDTLGSAFGIVNTIAGGRMTTLSGSSFQNCHDYCIYISNSNQATIDNNYFFVGQKYIVYAENSINYVFTNNVLVGARNRSSMIGSFMGDDIACYSQYTSLNWEQDNNKVQNNLCQGSQGTGFNLPHTPCQYLGSQYGFTNNVAGSAGIGFLLSGPMDCAGGQKLKAYACQTGVVTNPRAKSFVWDNLMFTDCKRAIGLRFGGIDQANNSMFWSNSYISAISRPNCSICYQPGNIPCTNLRAVRLLAMSQNTEQLPKIFGDGFQVICKAELFDSNAWIKNVTFENYQQSYTGAISSYCSKNMLFESHPIDDSSIGNHHFYESKCTNCDINALGHYDPPIKSHFGWLGGCGNFPCTGRSNYLIHDHDGGLLGYPGIIIPNNTDIGNHTQNCVYNKIINGHICNRTDFARLKYTSIAADFKSRIMWPVNLTYEGGNWKTSTNGWREWGWDGDEPLNTRMGRFLSIVQLYKIYNMTFEAQPPTDMLFSFSLPSLQGNNSQWVGIKIYYPIPNAITVVNQNGTSTKSILATDNDNIRNYVNQCGTHKYFYKNNTIHFIVTADSKCTVRVTLTSSVQVTARLSVNINTFYDTIGVTTFLDQMSAFLGITTDRLKIVGIYQGSTIVDYVILPPVIPVEQSSTAVPNSPSIVSDLRSLADKISNAKPQDFPSLPSFVGASATTNIMNVNGQAVIDNPVLSKNDTTKFIIIGVVVGVAVILLVGVSIYLIISKLRNKNPIIPQQSPDHFKQQASNDAIKADNRSQFQLRPIDMGPQKMNRIHPE